MTWWFAMLILIFLASLLAPDFRQRRRRVVHPKELGQLIEAGRVKTRTARGNEPVRQPGEDAAGAYHRLQ